MDEKADTAASNGVGAVVHRLDHHAADGRPDRPARHAGRHGDRLFHDEGKLFFGQNLGPLITNADDLEPILPGEPDGVVARKSLDSQRHPGVIGQMNPQFGRHPIVCPVASAVDDDAFAGGLGDPEARREVLGEEADAVDPRLAPEFTVTLRALERQGGAAFPAKVIEKHTAIGLASRRRQHDADFGNWLASDLGKLPFQNGVAAGL
ncbi:hypothetical protein SAMN05428963_11693 [Consotaella salsifontis]|uniref:Uncharacterized protein n=1 Tax=Consotaella salsifontis TaxID=1365950 RepID=A0A1T4T0Y5_9HYPH|nr:hypothetical protein SAMN05428963_11693 [Consotaella salsifontis]